MLLAVAHLVERELRPAEHALTRGLQLATINHLQRSHLLLTLAVVKICNQDFTSAKEILGVLVLCCTSCMIEQMMKSAESEGVCIEWHGST